MQHNVKILKKKIGAGLLEIAEDRIAEVLKHHKDARVEEKPSTITLKIILTPEDGGSQFDFEVKSGIAFAPRRGVSGTLYAGFDGIDGDVPKVAEINQGVITFDEDAVESPIS